MVAIVTGAIGERIQNWRLQHDHEQAHRLPPHASLSYWPPAVDHAEIERQVRHAFDRPVTARLGRTREFTNADGTFFVEVLETDELDAARARLFDGTHTAFEGDPTWTWHVTCVRYGNRQDVELLRRAAEDLVIDAPWTIDTIAYLELRGNRYETLAEWSVGTS